MRVDLQNLGRTIVPFVLAFAAFSGVNLTSASAQTEALANKPEQNKPDQEIAVDAFQVVGAPLGISNATLTASKQGYYLRFSGSNSSNEQLIGVRYLFLCVAADGVVRSIVEQSEDLKLDAYSSNEIRFRVPLALMIDHEDRVLLLTEQVIGRESIWQIWKAKDALQHYAKGDNYPMPDVWRFPNLVDTPERGSRVIP